MIRKLIATVAVSATLASPLYAQSKPKLVIGEQNWTGAIVIGNLIAEVVRTRFDADVSLLSADLPVLMSSAGKNDGSVDVLPDIYLPNQATAWGKYVAAGSAETLVPNANPYISEQGFYIPGYIQDEYGVTSVDDLKRPEIAELFKSPAGGKPEFLIGPAGWESTYISQIKAKDYGFAPLFEDVSTEASVTYARIDAAFKAKTGVLFYGYTPDWIFVNYDLRLLQEPEFDGYAQDNKKDDPLYNPDGKWLYVSPTEDPDWLNKSRITSAFPPSKVYVLHAKRLETDAPEIAAFLTNITIDPKVLNELIKQVEKDKETPEAAARAWVAANAAIVDGWVKGTP
ncbi:ABC transporter substrate-binding protein [Xinfangfangia sp. D13-10-4-6]|uniref:ABC transporter substrate-binding protein n=1 Tax=Pseudogemmobacter hezensis TaxID=2737662 RepID=UPI0015571AFA|nr:glycine betaine ABC transporter substrate-binding protein [Pseudogemmobacter hezensis]NPD14742.1 ABC transporter substrate-binding protein [Pseudogemmobacter hezensis]